MREPRMVVTGHNDQLGAEDPVSHVSGTADGNDWSPSTWRTRDGTRIVGSTSRASKSTFIRARRVDASGLALVRA